MKLISVIVKYDGLRETKTLMTKTNMLRRQKMRKERGRELRELLRMKPSGSFCFLSVCNGDGLQEEDSNFLQA